MQKQKKKTRDFRFYSKKGQVMVTTHNINARKYADWLENCPDAVSYECCVPLNRSEYIYVAPTGIRKAYFSTDWETDFRIYCKSGEQRVRELVRISDILKDATLEKLEFSRRYWAGKGITNWKIILITEA